MEQVISFVEGLQSKNLDLPFSVSSSAQEQHILNVSLAKPSLIFVMRGEKEIGTPCHLICRASHFVFLSDSQVVGMRNIPMNKKYFAIFLEFDYDDFAEIPKNKGKHTDHLMGEITSELKQCLTQFLELSVWAPPMLVSLRKKEILKVLYYLGYTELSSMIGKPKISHKIHDLLLSQNFQDIDIQKICTVLAVSESTLRRKLKLEKTSIQEIKDSARLGRGLHLLQTTTESISLIAEKCGYQSPSRFTQNFKFRFGLTPSELRKTKYPVFSTQ